MRNAQALTARHRVRGDELAVLTQEILDLAHDAAFHACHVGDDRTAFKKPLFFTHPLQERRWIQTGDDHVCRADHLRIRSRTALIDDMMLVRIANGVLVDIDCIGENALLGKTLGVAAADHAKSHDQYVGIFINFQCSLPQFLKLVIYQKSPESSCSLPPRPR